MKTTFPTYLSDLLAYNGYINYETISLLEESEIKQFEGFARGILPKLLSSNQENYLFFGIFAKETTLFHIVAGDRNILEILSEKCKLNIKEKTKLGDKKLEARSNCSTGRLRSKERQEKRTIEMKESLRENNLFSDENQSNAIDPAIDHIKSVVRPYPYKFIMNLEEKDRGNACRQCLL